MRATSCEVALFYCCIYGLACDALMAIGLLDFTWVVLKNGRRIA